VSVTSGAACANAERLIKALAQTPIANMDKVRRMISSHKSQQHNRICIGRRMLPGCGGSVNVPGS
jgi:hypothetical protein